MQAARLCTYWAVAAPSVRSSVITAKPALLRCAPIKPQSVISRNFSQESRFARRRRVIDLRPEAKEPSSIPFDIGKAALAGGAVFGVGALCYYGLGFSSKPGALEQSVVWPEYVKQRVRDTYMYFGASLGVTAAAASAAFRSPQIMRLVSAGGFVGIAATMAALVGTGMLCRSIKYEPGFGTKQLAWLLHSATLGAVIAPICFLGGPLLIRAAWYTGGVIGGLSAVACCAPSDKFLYMAGPLAMGMGVVLVSSIGSAFLPPTAGLLGASLYSISLYGGLLVMSGMVLYDTQRIVRVAETHYDTKEHPFDPINMSIGIYLDTINIFVRIATLLAGGGSNKRR
uniref:Growth hormone-inducible transmembrane protein n=2 Tax=Lygus hesperus TaxID=30085 RepID=A0A146KQJ1_LYGHE